MLNSRVRCLCVAACFVAFSVWLVGCGGSVGGPETEPVSGRVTLDGEPLVDAKVVFMPGPGGMAASGVTDESGDYVLTTFNPQDGAKVGDYKVTITKASVDRLQVDLEGLSEEEKIAKAAEAYYGSDQAKKLGDPKAQAAEKSDIPTKYNNIASSGLTAKVVAGKNTFNFELTSN